MEKHRRPSGMELKFRNIMNLAFKHRSQNGESHFRKYLARSLLLLMPAMVAGGLFGLSKSRTYQVFGVLIDRINTDQKVVALTFDDGPNEYTDDVLKILSENDVHATFYAIGQSLEKHPDLAKAIVEQGNELGNHSHSHKRLVFKSQSFLRNELEKTDSLIRKAGYAGEITFRPPYGKKLFGLPWYLSRKNTKTVMWDLEPDTYFSGHANLIAKHVLENARPGSIILLHPFCGKNCESDREALPKIISGLKERGYSFVTISGLLGYAE